MNSPDATTLPEWFLWIAGLAATGAGSLFAHLYAMLDKAMTTAAQGDRDIWDTLNKQRASSQVFREDIIRTVASLPTKTDHAQMELRIMAAIKDEK